MKSGESRSFAKGDSCRIPRACGGEWENSHKERKKRPVSVAHPSVRYSTLESGGTRPAAVSERSR